MSKHSPQLSGFERALLGRLLGGENAALAHLRRQASVCIVTSREYSSVGLFVNLHVDRMHPPAPVEGVIGDVYALVGTGVPLGFLLFLEEGYLSMIEGFSCDDTPWPEVIEESSLVYSGKREFDPGAVDLSGI